MSSKVKIRNSILQFLIRNGIYAARATSNQRLKEFFSQIKPYTTNHELIRLGGNSDGGYLVPNDLEGIQACFSPGVSQVASFELDLAERNIPSFMADYSVESPPLMHKLFDFEKKYLGIENNDVFMTLQSWMQVKAPLGSEFILQMDIEGAEYGVLLHTPRELLNQFRIIIIEFHNLEGLFFPNGFELINITFSKLLQDFEIVHMHPNNCRPPLEIGQTVVPQVMEFTFLRKDRISSKVRARQFPHPLDVKNLEQYADVPLPPCWQN